MKRIKKRVYKKNAKKAVRNYQLKKRILKKNAPRIPRQNTLDDEFWDQYNEEYNKTLKEGESPRTRRHFNGEALSMFGRKT